MSGKLLQLLWMNRSDQIGGGVVVVFVAVDVVVRADVNICCASPCGGGWADDCDGGHDDHGIPGGSGGDSSTSDDCVGLWSDARSV